MIFAIVLIFGFSEATILYANNAPTKKIKKIIVSGSTITMPYKHSYTLEYDSLNRIIEIIPDNSEMFGVTRFEYGTETFRISKDNINVSCSLNEHGYIEVAEESFYPISLVGKMVYDEKGQLVATQFSELDTIHLTWENGNMIQMNFEDGQIDFDYTTLENKNRFGLLLEIEGEYCTLVFPYYMLLGKVTKHLPQSIKQGEEKIFYQYKTDKDGYVTQIDMTYSSNSCIVIYGYTFSYF